MADDASDSKPRDRLPPYRKIAEDLRAEIKAGRYLPGQQVPSVTKLCESYNVTRNTAIRALRVLKDDGWIVVEQGWGSFVADNPPAD